MRTRQVEKSPQFLECDKCFGIIHSIEKNLVKMTFEGSVCPPGWPESYNFCLRCYRDLKKDLRNWFGN